MDFKINFTGSVTTIADTVEQAQELFTADVGRLADDVAITSIEELPLAETVAGEETTSETATAEASSNSDTQ